MSESLRTIGTAVARGLGWAAVWAPIAVAVGMLVIDPDNSMDEMWVMIGALPGFLCGVFFSLLLAAAARGRAIDEVPAGQLAAAGAVAGLVVGLIPFTIGDYAGALPLWQFTLIVMASFALLSALSAIVSGMVSRSLRRRQLGRA